MLIPQSIQDFFIQHGFVLELLFSIGLFTIYLERKQLFPWRVLLVSALLLLFSVAADSALTALAGILGRTVASILKYLSEFLIGYAGILFCFETRQANAVFAIICAAAAQHLAYSLYSCLMIAAGLQYGAGSAFLILFVTLLVGAAVYLVFVRRLRDHEDQYANNKTNILVGGIIITANLVLHFLTEEHVTINSSPRLFVFISGYEMICCVLTLMTEHGLFRNRVLATDNELLARLLAQQEERYQISKDSMEMINIKCHDMRHMISQLTSADRETAAELEEIISIYDANLRTGNETLDLCLMEKKLLCEKHRIAFDCIVNGASLAFMKPADIFSLFGNALDNAIEASCRIDNPSMRMINLSVREQLGMVVIHVENNFDQELVFVDGLPRTTKDNEVYHGFGLRSIQAVTKKYRGNASVLVRDGVFNLNITIPLPEEAAEEPGSDIKAPPAGL